MRTVSSDNLVSVIIPTKNSAKTLEACLKSIRSQSYKTLEVIVVDNHSIDSTRVIAKKYGVKVFIKGPERSAQVNYGVKQAKGGYVYKVDSDFVLDKNVIQECINEVKKGFEAVVVHNSPDVSVSWIARIRKFEVDMYKYNLTHSSARFIKKSVYIKIGGFNPSITAGEDYDFQNRLNRNNYKTGFISSEAIHLGEPKKLLPHLVKYYQYGKDFINYKKLNRAESARQLGIFRKAYLMHYKSFLKHPLLALEFLFYNTLKYTAGGLGLLTMKIKSIGLLK